MIRCKLIHLVEKAKSRGYTLQQVEACIVGRDGDTITVDETHPAYPHPRKGLGDHVADGLAAVGITKERVARWTGKKDCGCKKRQELLNKLGQKVVDFVRGNNADQLDDKPH